MGIELVDIKFTDPDTKVVSFGTCAKVSLNRWLGRGYEKATAEEVAAARVISARGDTVSAESLQKALSISEELSQAGVPAEDLGQGLDGAHNLAAAGDGEPVTVVEASGDVLVKAPETGTADPASGTAPATTDSDGPAVAGDSTAGDDADSIPGAELNRSARGRR
jgi:hypothetical protein